MLSVGNNINEVSRCWKRGELMYNSDLAEIGLFIKQLEKSYEGQQNQELQRFQRKKKRAKKKIADKNSKKISYSDIYRKAMIVEFLRGK